MVINMKSEKIYLFEDWAFDNPVKYHNIYVYQVAETLVVAGEEVPEHIQICDEITYIISGEAVAYNNDKPVNLKAGDIHIACKGESHKILVGKSENCRYVCFGIALNHDSKKYSMLESIFSGEKVVSAKSADEIRMLVTMLMNELYTKPDFSEDMIEMLILQIMIFIYRKREKRKNVFKENVFDGKVIYEILRYIDLNLTKIQDIQMISKELSYIKYYISHLFKEKLGITIYEYITERKIDLAKTMLEEGTYKMSEIAEKLNYESTQSFSKMFKRRTGISPSKYGSGGEN